jgi:dCMP deaminase
VRSSWDETWMNVADAIAARSRCVNRQVGAVIVTRENRPMAVGYNGPPANLFVTGEYCDSFCPRGGSVNRGASYSNCVSVHAEVNALLFADRRDYEGGTIYVTSPPCWDCAKVVANSGVSRVVLRVSGVDGHYDNDVSIDFIRSCGIVVDVVEGVSR